MPSPCGSTRSRHGAAMLPFYIALIGSVLLTVVSHASASSWSSSASLLLGYNCVLPDTTKPLVSGASPHVVLCGEETWLSVKAEIAIPANLSVYEASKMVTPVPLAPKASACTFRDDIRLPISGSRISEIKATENKWVVDVNVSFPDELDTRDFEWTKGETAVSLLCVFTVSGEDVNLDVSIPPFVYLDREYELRGLTLLNKPIATATAAADDGDGGGDTATVAPTTVRRRHLGDQAAIATPLLGIGQIARFQLDLTGRNAKHRLASLSGSCVINKSNVTVVAGHVNYTVQANDSDLVGLKYKCQLVDGAGNVPSKAASGAIQHVVLQIDGTVPHLEDDLFMLFSSDKPARIGSVISLTLQATNLTQGFSGTCQVNGVNGVPLLEAQDHGFYMVQYTVSEGDRSVQAEGDESIMPLKCVVHNQAGNSYLYQNDVELGFAIDPVRPEIQSTSLLFASDHPAHEGTIIEIQVALAQDEPQLRISNNQSCQVNNVSVGASFSMASPRAFLVTYVVGKGQANWKAGALPVHCVVQDAAGNTAIVNKFTDGNTLFARELKPMEIDAQEVMSTEFLPDKLLLISFVIVAIASHTISQACPHLGLPRISGYIVTGILVGPYVLNFLTTPQLRQLRIIDELSMAYIGLTAGSKLHWNHMKPIMKSILFITIGLTFVEYIIGTLTITVLAGYIDFLQDTSESEKYAIALLAGCMMIARSPSSALAVIEETKSQGHFTTLIFAVTVMCDVLVIFLFNVNSMITESFLSEKEMSSDDFLKLVLQLCGSICVGIVLGQVMSWVVFWRPRRIKRKSVWFKCQQICKQVLILLYGWMVFVICHLAHPYLEPLLCCMVSGAVMWNTSANPEELGILLKQLADFVYVCFFTITGATLELDMLGKAMMLSLVLCGTRVIGIFIGSFAGGMCAGEDKGHCQVAWMAYITQAGVTLGLAKQIQIVYPGWGSYFSTMIVAVVICNQLIGPPLLRFVLRFVGDAKKKEMGKVDGLVAVVFSGRNTPNAQSAVLRLEMCGWNVHSQELLTKAENGGGDSGSKQDAEYHALMSSQVDEVLATVKPLEVVVVMMPSDDDNYHVIKAITDTCQRLRRIRVLRVVVQVAGRGDGGDDTGRNGRNGLNGLNLTTTSTRSLSSRSDSGLTDITSMTTSDETKWAAKFADMPVVLEHGDTIDVIVVDRVEATDMLIELAANGKVINFTEKQPTTAIAMEDGDTDLESDSGVGGGINDTASISSSSSTSSRGRLRQTLTHTVRRMRLV